MFVQGDENIRDCLIVGGGLAGGLLLHALRAEQPSLDVLLLERGENLGGNHTWSFHDSDIPAEAAWLQPLISKVWPAYEVRFPKYQRQINSSYCSIKSHEFHQKLIQWHTDHIWLQAPVRELTNSSVTLMDGRVLKAKQVIDARGWRRSEAIQCGYQKFVGLELNLSKPHGLKHVILKDALVAQVDGYRFIYVLPWNDTELLIEDTYYSNSADIDVESLKAGILKYAADNGWQVASVGREEVGCLPLALYNVSAPADSSEVLNLGASSGVYQPVTGYTFPQTVACVQALAKTALQDWPEVLSGVQYKYQRQSRYLRILNRMMFLAAVPEKRYVILERFYQLSEGLIERFYQGRLSAADQLRILCGKPPVSVWRALKSLF